ncbi:YadA-like family protein [Vibrio tubiashii]|uniref:YadA-like family protein n=1 Tax=Vibrio tubiashii TaxID=29498 RepID=UPI00234EE1A5|nr:YadA-like family protein [Vibrio tubiashii]WCP69876.1 YadA-like family protein [Vibrio tubiashii]
MKKTILALTVTSLFSGAALAAVAPIHAEQVEKEIRDNFTVIEGGRSATVIGEDGSIHTIKDISESEGGKSRFEVVVDDGMKGKKVAVEFDRYGNLTKVGEATIPFRGNDIMEKTKVASPVMKNDLVKAARAAVDEHGLTVKANGGIYQGKNKVGKVNKDGSGVFVDPKTGTSYQVEVGANGEPSKVIAVDKNGNAREAIVSPDDVKPVPPIHIEDDVKKAAEEVERAAKQYDTDVKAAQDWARQAEAEFKQEVARLDSKIDTMEGRVSNGTAMVGAMSQMQFGHSGLGVGAGVAEFNGSKAVAVGVGYAFGAEKQWMAKGSFGYAESRKGKGSKDTMAAAGLTYSFK